MSATWYNIYLPLWISGQMSPDQLDAALNKNRITTVEYEKIVTTQQENIIA